MAKVALRFGCAKQSKNLEKYVMFKAHARAQWDEICFEVAPIFHVLALFLKFKYCAKTTNFKSIFHVFIKSLST